MSSAHTGIDALLLRAAELAGDYLRSNSDRSLPVLRYMSPQDLEERLALSLPEHGRPLADLIVDAQAILEHSVRTGHPRFMNQLFGGSDPAALLGEWMAALVNGSMYTYEAAPVATLMELRLIERMCKLAGFQNGEGIFEPGGSLSNLMAVLAARLRAFPHVKEDGLQAQDRPVMFVSQEAHYSLRRAASIAGIGTRGAVEIETDAVGRMSSAALRLAIRAARKAGRTPFMIAATAGTTVPGAYDPIDELADIAAAEDMWLHVDGAYGGSVLFSEKHKHLMRGVERADSLGWNPHKMMGVPLSCSATLMREKGTLQAVNGMHADYLFHGNEDSQYDLGDKSLQCGRRADALKLWLSWQASGDRGYAERVDRMFELAEALTSKVRAREGFQLVREPQAANVCFRYLAPAARGLAGAQRLASQEQTTVHVRGELLRSGKFLLNYATLDGAATFRPVLNNPDASEDDLELLLDEIERIAQAAHN